MYTILLLILQIILCLIALLQLRKWFKTEKELNNLIEKYSLNNNKGGK